MTPITRESKYHEDLLAPNEFTGSELRKLRFLLRRLRFLERQMIVNDTAQNPDAEHSGMFVAMEVEALEWTLTEIGYLDLHKAPKKRSKK